jgi:hypothetical protein
MKIILIFLLIGLAGNAAAQRYPFVNYTTRNGLVQSNITDIKQDKHGNIWIGTAGGLSKFDGRKFTNYDDRQVLQSLNILSILCDSTGIVWVGTGNGLLQYDHRFKTFFQPKDTVQARTSSLTTYGNRIYFICNSHIYEIINNRSVRPVHINDSLENTAQFISFDLKGNLWIISDAQKVFRCNKNSIKEFPKPQFIDKFYSNTFGFIRLNGNTGDEPFFVANFGTLCISGDTLAWFAQKYPKFSDAEKGAATFVLKDKDSTLWVGATRGLVKLVGSDSVVGFSKINGFGDHSVSTIMRDRENNLWIGSTYYGVYKLSNEALFNIPPTDKFEFRNIQYSGSISENTALIGTWGSGPFLLKDRTITPMEFQLGNTMHGPGINYIAAVCHVGNVTYVGCLDEGMWKVQDGSTKLYRVQRKEREAPVNNIIRYHDKFIVQEMDGTTYLYGDNFHLLRTAPSMLEMIRFDGAKIYLMQSIGKTNVIDSNFNLVEENVFPEINSDVSQIVECNGKTIVSTIGEGIFFYDANGNLLSKIDKKTGLHSNVVTSLLVDGDALFAGTNYGLVKIDMRSMKTRIFNENEGMFSGECRWNGLLKLSRDAILIATTNGPYIYYPSLDKTASLAKGYIQLLSLTAQGNKRTVNLFDTDAGNHRLLQKIPFAQNDISISFKGVSQRAPESIEYHYQLEGFADSAWNMSVDDAPVEYHQLPPGDYVFTVFLKVKDYVSPPASVTFTVKKPLQGEWWFQLIVLSVIAILVLFFLVFVNRLYQKYIQTRITDEFGRSVKRKNNQIIRSIEDMKQSLADVMQMPYKHDDPGAGQLSFMYANGGLSRMRDLVQRESITLKDFHEYFNDVMFIPEKEEKKIYQEVFDPSIVIPMDRAFSLMEIFSLYMTWKLSENPHFLFSLTSEVRSSQRLVIRCYQLNSLNVSLPSTLEVGFRKMLKRMKNEHWNIAFIENPETSSMLIVELEI